MYRYVIYIYITIYIYGFASKFGYGSARGDPDVWIGLDHLRFGMDRGYGSVCGFKVWIGALHFDSQPYREKKTEVGDTMTITIQIFFSHKNSKVSHCRRHSLVPSCTRAETVPAFQPCVCSKHAPSIF